MYTTIQISDGFHQRLKDEKRDGESYEACLKRLLNGGGLTDQQREEVRGIVRDMAGR